MSTYREDVFKAAKERSSEEFENGTPDHAADLTEALLQNAQSEFLLLTRKFDIEFYAREGIVNQFITFLQKSFTRVKVIVQEPIEIAKHPWIVAAKAAGLSHAVEVLQAKGSFADPTVTFNFAVADGFAYRTEDLNCDSTTKSVKGKASFFAPKKASELENTFAEAYALAKPKILAS
jgi:hypothetical protein